MQLDPAILGSGVIVSSSLIGIYLLVQKFRDHFKESPDPKLTYATIKQYNQIQQQLTQNENKIQKSIEQLRLEVKNDSMLRDRDYRNTSEALHQLVRQTLQDVAALQAESKNTQSRISELSSKTDKLLTFLIRPISK